MLFFLCVCIHHVMCKPPEREEQSLPSLGAHRDEGGGEMVTVMVIHWGAGRWSPDQIPLFPHGVLMDAPTA